MKKVKQKATLKAKLLLMFIPIVLLLLLEGGLWLALPDTGWDFEAPVLADMIAQVNMIDGDLHTALDENPLLRSNYSMYDSDRTLFWKLKPNFSERIYNFMSPLILTPALKELGLIDKARFHTKVGPHRYAGVKFNKKKEKGVFRLICLGDSNTFGWGVNPDESYPLMLARRISEKLPQEKVEVINMGVPGYSSLQGKVLTEEQVSLLGADLVIVEYGFNDRWMVARSDNDQLEGACGFMNEATYYAGKSRIITGLRYLAEKVLLKGEANKKDVGNLTPEEIKKLLAERIRRVNPKEYKDNMTAICGALQKAGSKVVFLDFYSMGGWGDSLRAAAKECDVKVIDGEKYINDLLDKIIKKEPACEEHTKWALSIYGQRACDIEPRLYLYNDNCHPNAYGYELLGDYVADEVIKLFFTGK